MQTIVNTHHGGTDSETDTQRDNNVGYVRLGLLQFDCSTCLASISLPIDKRTTALAAALAFVLCVPHTHTYLSTIYKW